VQTFPGPVLTVNPLGTNVVVSWPLYASAYQLFYATNLAPPVSWLSVTRKTVTNGIIISATIPHTGGAEFFRLQK